MDGSFGIEPTEEPVVFAWTDERIALLTRHFCLDGETMEEIGKRLGCSKNAVIGKVHRLGLERGADAPMNEAQRGLYAYLRERPERPKQRPVENKFPPFGCCVYPLGHPGEEGFHFCGERVAVVGRPYCGAHHAVAYIPIDKVIKKGWRAAGGEAVA